MSCDLIGKKSLFSSPVIESHFARFNIMNEYESRTPNRSSRLHFHSVKSEEEEFIIITRVAASAVAVAVAAT